MPYCGSWRSTPTATCCTRIYSRLCGGPEYRDDVDYLRAYIRYLRRKLEADPANPKHIVTVSGVGYMQACPEGEQPESCE